MVRSLGPAYRLLFRPPSNLLNRSVTVNFGRSASAALMGPGRQPAAATVPAYFIDEDNANPLAAWVAMGSPAVPSPEQLKALIAASEVHPVQVRCPPITLLP